MMPPRPRAESRVAMKVLADLLETRTGQQIGHDRAWRIETALQPLMRERGYDRLDALAAATAGSHELATAAVNAMLNHESSFFRDAQVFDVVAEIARDLRASEGKRRLRVWSAGCSIGQEPVSLAITFAEAGAGGGDDSVEILATDVSDVALARARSGTYSQFEIQRGLSIRRLMEWFETNGTEWTAKRDLLRNVQYRRMNLVADPLPGGRFDIVMCRNVLLYLPPASRRLVLDRIATRLRPGGLLALGAGETVIGQSDGFRPSQRYRGLYELANSARASIAAA
ncbi:protein-glutamate O-methyltransferase CheR [soil metagenome]